MKLKFYEIDKIYQNHIIKFLKGYNQANKQIEVSKMDSDFKGVQVATNDNFNKILSCGYTDDWVIDPKIIFGAKRSEVELFWGGFRVIH